MVFDLLINMHPILFHSIIAIASLIVLAKSADMMVFSISDYAKKLGISDYLIGFLVVSIGTALPELVAALNGVMLNVSDIVFGTILGSNLFKIPLLGIILIIAKKIKTKFGDIGYSPFITLIITILPFILILDDKMSRVDGIILLAMFLLYIMKLWKGEGQLGKIKKSVKFDKIFKDSVIFILSLVALLLSARWLVFSSLKLSENLKISPFLIGIIVIGIGASAPETSVQIRSVLRKHQNLAFGNVLGSIVANSALVLGLVALIKPFPMDHTKLLLSGIFIVFGLIAVLVIMQKEVITWKQGTFLILVYILYLLAEWIF